MQKLLLLATLALASFAATAQETQLLPRHKSYIDSLLARNNRLNLNELHRDPYPLVFPEVPGIVQPGNFQRTNPGAALLAATARGNVYSLRPDNMHVLVPSMGLLEKIPAAAVLTRLPRLPVCPTRCSGPARKHGLKWFPIPDKIVDIQLNP
jgi:hypothetical protein